MNKSGIILLFFFFYSMAQPCLWAQRNYSGYNFLHLHNNRIEQCNNSPNYNYLMSKMTQLCKGKQNNTEILHIGDSHIQAGFYSNELRTLFQNFFYDDSTAGYGLLFPFETAKTNNPADYNITWNGKWDHCKTNGEKTSCKGGIFPLMLKTKDTLATISIHFKDYYSFKKYLFNKVKIYCEYPDSHYNITINNHPVKQNDNNAIAEIDMNKTCDSLTLKVTKTNDTTNKYFRLSGFNLIRKNHPFYYHAVGVNGAKIKSYLNSPHFEAHLKSINPDWIILSLGTNEAYNQNFREENFEENLRSFIKLIRTHTDSTWITFTTPGDALWDSKVPNKNNSIARQIIIDNAKELGYSYWDFYNIMGNNNSIEYWYNHGLAAKDKLHLSPEGYRLKAALFFEAFKKRLNEYLNNQAD